MKDKVRVGIVGCGAFARSEHMPNCKRNPKIEVAVCCSRSEKNRQLAVELCQPERTTPYAEEVFKADDVDMVILSVPHDQHEHMIAAAAAAGKHLFCEKPMSMSMAESYRIVRAVKTGGVKLCVDYNRRYSPSIQDMKTLYLEHRRNPKVNPGRYVEAPSRAPFPEEETTMMLIRINDESSTYRLVHMDWQTGGGQIIGECCHWLDLACYLLERKPVRVFATGSSRLNHIITVDFEGGSRLGLFFSANGTFEYPKELIEITDHGALFINECFVENKTFGAVGESQKTYPLQFDECPEAGQEGGLSGYLAKLRRRAEMMAESQGKEWRDLFPNKGHYELLDAFVDSILNDTPSPISEVDGAKATYLSLRAVESVRLGIPVPVNEEEFEFYVD